MLLVSSVNVDYVVGIVNRVEKTENVTKYITSYGLKHLVEKLLSVETNKQVSYITNEELIEGMFLAGFSGKKTWTGSSNFHFNVSKKSLYSTFRRVIN